MPQNVRGVSIDRLRRYRVMLMDKLKNLIPAHYLRLFFLILSFAVVLSIILFIWKFPQWQVEGIADPKDRVTLENATLGTLIQILVQVSTGYGLFLTTFLGSQNLKLAQQNLTVTEETQITERFSKAIEQLGNPNIHVRLGAIYALERISKDSDKDYWQVMEILTAYIRETSPYPPRDEADNKSQKDEQSDIKDDQKVVSPKTDIQAILTIIGRRTKSYGQGEENNLDLSKTDLRGADLTKANLSKAFLKEANLKRAVLKEAVLKEVVLERADLTEANLWDADLTEACLWGADLTEAYLEKADLTKANLWGAKNLTSEQVQIAQNWEDAIYDEDFRTELDLT